MCSLPITNNTLDIHETTETTVSENLYEGDFLYVQGARMHNLKNIDVKIPRNKLVVITGISGCGKSSLAFDTIYAEGQRRYMETFSAYARHFIGNLERPDVDRITGLSPVISIEQKTANRNPRSTVGTITEIYDFLRLLYARVADAFSMETGELMVKYSENQIIELISEKYKSKNAILLAPLVKGRKGHYRELFEQIRRQGFLKVRIDGKITELSKGMQTDRYKVHDIEVVIDKIKVDENNIKRMTSSLAIAMKQGKGVVLVIDEETANFNYYSRLLMCPTTGISYNEPEPNSFSFNSPYGACPKCNGLGEISEIDINKIIPDKNKSIKQGAIAPVGIYKANWIFKQLEGIGQKFDFNLDTPFKDIPEQAVNVILYGSDEVFRFKSEQNGISNIYTLSFEGIVNFIVSQQHDLTSASMQKWINGFMNKISCPHCKGARLKPESLHFKIDNKNISEVASLDLISFKNWIDELPNKLDKRKNLIAFELIREITNRTKFLIDVGLDYLTLNRAAGSLSGGESQRIRLATQIGSGLTNVLYILDEPSIGLHQRDNLRLIEALKNLRDAYNSVIVVEHDEEMIQSADYIVDIGPGAGVHGGYIVAQGTPSEIIKTNTLTAQYLNGSKQIEVPSKRRKGNGNKIILKGANGNNLKKVDLELPLGTLICVTGVSGSGKSSIINETLYPAISKKLYRSERNPLPYKTIEGLELIDKVIEIDQSPIGRTPRSNPATYTGMMDEIRKLFSSLPESKIRAYTPGRFSFNVKGGRCETCGGAGVKTIEMNFLPDVYVLCDSCNGMRYNRETLEVRYKGKSINDVLNMTVGTALEFFENIPKIYLKLKTLNDVGLSYLTLGQQSTTLSGGEAQRVKLSSELSKRNTGKTLYILDEPTTGLHFEDVRVLMNVLNRLVDLGNTVLIIEHNMDVIKTADYIIDLGPEGGERGGKIVCEGTPEDIIKNNCGYTSKYLKNYIFNKNF